MYVCMYEAIRRPRAHQAIGHVQARLVCAHIYLVKIANVHRMQIFSLPNKVQLWSTEPGCLSWAMLVDLGNALQVKVSLGKHCWLLHNIDKAARLSLLGIHSEWLNSSARWVYSKAWFWTEAKHIGCALGCQFHPPKAKCGTACIKALWFASQSTPTRISASVHMASIFVITSTGQ